MAFGIKYQYAFGQEVKTKPDQLPVWLRVSFLFADYVGDVIQVVADADDPLSIEFSDPTDNVFEPIVPLLYTFNLACEETWQASEFYVKTNRDIQVLIEIDRTGEGTAYEVDYRGWIDSSDLKEPYKAKPYIVQVTGTCGLASLKDISLLDKDGNRLTGMVSHAEIMRTALYHTGLPYDLVTVYNLFEQFNVSAGQTDPNGNAIVGIDPLHNKMEHADRFLTDSYNTMTCWDALLIVLEQLLQLKQGVGAKWFVTRQPELTGGWDPWDAINETTVRARNYVSPGLSDAPIFELHESLDFTVNLGDHEALRAALDQCNHWRQPVEAGVLVKQDFGRRLSSFVNGDMIEVDSANHPTGWQSVMMLPESWYRIGTGTNADPFRLVIEGAGDQKFNKSTPYVFTYVEYATDSDDYQKFQKRTLKGKAELVNARAAKIIIIEERNDGPYLLTGGDLVRFDQVTEKQAVAILEYNVHKELVYANKTYEKDVPNVGVFEYEIDLGKTDKTRKIIVGFSFPEALDRYNENGKVIGPELGENGIQPKCIYYPPVLEVVQEGLVLDGTQQKIVQPGKTITDATLTLTLGDVPATAKPINRVGTTYRSIHLPTLEPTTLWFRPDANPGGVGHGVIGSNTQLGWVTEDLAKQRMLGPSTFEGTTIGPMPWGGHSVLVVADLSESRRYALTRWKWRCKKDAHEATWQELMSDKANTTLPNPLKQWVTPTGVIPMNVGEDGAPVAPTEKPGRDDKDDLIKKLIGLGVFNPTIGAVVPQPGYTPVSPHAVQIGADIYTNGILKGSILSVLRKQVKLPYPL